jgi:predicted transcriptional regulator
MSEKPPLGLSPRERQIMDVVYRRGRATVQEVLEEMPDPPSYSAVRATMRVLEDKGRLRHKEEGRKYVYHPSVAPEHARRNALQHIVKTFFNGSAEQAAVALLRMSDTGLAQEELDRLAARIEEARKKGR